MITNNNRLSQDEERRLIRLAQDGDVKARNKLIEDNVWVAAWYLKRFTVPNYYCGDKTDIMNRCIMSMIQGIGNYKLERHTTRLASYLHYYVRSGANREMVTAKKQHRLQTEGHDGSATNTDGAEEDTIVDRLDRSRLYRLAKTYLTPRTYVIFRLVYERHLNQPETGREIGISKQRIGQLDDRVIDELRFVWRLWNRMRSRDEGGQ